MPARNVDALAVFAAAAIMLATGFVADRGTEVVASIVHSNQFNAMRCLGESVFAHGAHIPDLPAMPAPPALPELPEPPHF